MTERRVQRNRIEDRLDRTKPPSLGLSTKGLKKGDATTYFDDGWLVAAIIIEVLSSTHALTRIMEGPLAGEELEAEYPLGTLEFLSS